VTAVVLGAAWAVAVALLGARPPVPRPLRVDEGAPNGRLPRPAAAATATRCGLTAVAAVGVVGALLRLTAGRPPDPGADRRAGWAALAALALVWASPALAVLPPLAAVAAPALKNRRSARRHQAAVVDEVPDLVDLLTITATAGLPVSAALVVLGPRVGGVLGPALERTAAMLGRGATVAEALDELAGTGGAPLRPLIEALAEHDRYGSALRPALDRVAIEARLRRRRAAEEAARRLPVTLLFPLVLTTLPAFALLTVVPLLAGSLGSMSL
jgi:tight adherence protein C